MFDPGAPGGLSPVVARRLFEALLEDELSALESEWVIACADPITGMATYSGPYRSGADAMAVLLWEQEGQAGLPEADRFDFSMIRLNPPTPVADGVVVGTPPTEGPR